MNRTNDRLRFSAGLLLSLLLPVLAFPLAAVGQTDPSTPKTGPSQDSGDAQAGQKPKPILDLSGPRATMRTFLVAIQAASGAHPERIDDAVACLDTSKLEGDDVVGRARSLARRLHDLIDAQGVQLADIPEEAKAAEYFFYPADGQPGERHPEEIRLALDSETGHWLFTHETLTSIPLLAGMLKERQPEEKPKAAETTVPATRRTPRATMNTFIKAMNADPPDVNAGVHCLNPTGRNADAWGIKGKELASTLKTVMNKLRVVVLTEIPDQPDGPPYVFYTSETGNIVLERVDAVDDATHEQFGIEKGEWRFTSPTLRTLNALYDGLEDKAMLAVLAEAGVKEHLTLRQRIERTMPEWLRAEYFQLKLWEWLALAALLPAGWIIMGAASAISGLALRSWLRRREIDVDRRSQQRVVRSFGAAVAVIVWLLAIQIFALPDAVLGVVLRGLKLALGVTIVWFGYRCVDIIGGHIAANKDVRITRFDDVLIPMLRRILRVFVVLVAVLLILDWMGWAPTTVLGALGIGGVALAFAAQDTIGNFFGSITVLFDRPFGIGDWIVIGEVEGTVEHVGFRSTRVRTFYNSVVTIPNARMVNLHVDNYGARRFRRMKIMLSVTYSTPPEKIEAFCEGIRELIRLHPYTRKDYYHVYFNQFAASSLDILLYAFLEVPDWGTELRERHRLFLDIARLAERLGVEFAFPTQTVWLSRSPQGAPAAERVVIAPGQDDPEAVGVEKAAGLFQERYGAATFMPAPVVIVTSPRSRRDKGQRSGPEKRS